MSYEVTRKSTYETTNEALEAAAKSIRTMKTDLDESAVDIGALVHGAIRRGDGRGVSWKALHRLSKLAKMPARKLGYCHEAYLVARIAGDGLATRLPEVSFDLYRQFARVLKADGPVEWMREAILKAADEVSRGLPAWQVGGLIDDLLAGRHVAGKREDDAPWFYEPLSGLAMVVDAFDAAHNVAA